MSKAKYKFVGILLFFTLLGLVVITPATSLAPSWVGDGKYARYLGGFNIEIGTSGQPGYIKAAATATFNWTMSGTTGTEVRIDGGWGMSINVNFNNTPLLVGSFDTTGYEIIRLTDSQITTGGGYDLFGLEKFGAATVLWVENPGALPPANVSIGGRSLVMSSVLINLTMPYPMNFSGVRVNKYYDTGTGMLMALNVVLNITGMMGGLGGLGALGDFTFPIPVVSTNVVPFAWTIGGDTTLWLTAIGILLGVSALFGVIIYARKR